MTAYSQPELGIELKDFVATVEIQRPPLNFFDFKLIQQIADTLEALDKDPDCRSVVLCANGKAFCAGADFSSSGEDDDAVDRLGVGDLYEEATRIFACRKPIVAAVHGAAIGGGLGLAMSADFRVCSEASRFAANFTRLGFHPGFGLTHVLPRAIGQQRAWLMFYTSRRIKGDEAVEWGLADVLAPVGEERKVAWDLAREIAENSPLGLATTRETLRQGLSEAVKAATARELAVQEELRHTEDFAEGVRATAAREVPNFKGR